MTFRWLKGHGTENDFILLPDHDGAVHGDLDAGFVAALCHRRRGLGADGVLRVVRSAAIGARSRGEWFMDYRNADGSISEMCGNGVRVFARHLIEEGLAEPDASIVVGTRDGDKIVTVAQEATGHLTVDMGHYQVHGTSLVETAEGAWKGLDVRTGNPHAVAFVDDVRDAGPLIEEPAYDHTVYPDGVNIEFVARVEQRHIAMRVHERGSGETRSCGTGACAAAIAASVADGAATSGADGGVDGGVEYRVDLPGGTVHVGVFAGRVTLTGPAEIVARGEMEWCA